MKIVTTKRVPTFDRADVAAVTFCLDGCCGLHVRLDSGVTSLGPLEVNGLSRS